MLEALEATVVAAREERNHTETALEQIRACLYASHYNEPTDMVTDLQACLQHADVDQAQQPWWVRRALQECAFRNLPAPGLRGTRPRARKNTRIKK